MNNSRLYGIIFLLTLIGTLMRFSECLQNQDLYISVAHIPKAESETNIPFAFSLIQCSSACLLRQDTCQGIVMDTNQLHPCTLLEGFTGEKDDATSGIQAYVSTIFNGKRYIIKTSTMNWNAALTYCQSFGWKMASYENMEKMKNRMVGTAGGITTYVGAKKDSSNPSDIKDINTNSIITVAWAPNGQSPLSYNIVVVMESPGFRLVTDHHEYPNATVFCYE